MTLQDALEKHWLPDSNSRRRELARLVREDTAEDGWARLLCALDFIERGMAGSPIVPDLLRKAKLEFNAEGKQDMAETCNQLVNLLPGDAKSLLNLVQELVCVPA